MFFLFVFLYHVILLITSAMSMVVLIGVSISDYTLYQRNSTMITNDTMIATKIRITSSLCSIFMIFTLFMFIGAAILSSQFLRYLCDSKSHNNLIMFVAMIVMTAIGIVGGTTLNSIAFFVFREVDAYFSARELLRFSVFVNVVTLIPVLFLACWTPLISLRCILPQQQPIAMIYTNSIGITDDQEKEFRREDMRNITERLNRIKLT